MRIRRSGLAYFDSRIGIPRRVSVENLEDEPSADQEASESVEEITLSTKESESLVELVVDVIADEGIPGGTVDIEVFEETPES